MARTHRLERLLNPRSVVLVGASERNLFSNVAMRTLGDLEFDGRIHLVNRRGGEVYGRSAATSCRSLGEPVDAAYMTVPFEGLLDSVRDAIEAGIRNIVIVTGGFAEVGGEGARRQDELAALCAAKDVRVLGPNCLGFRNVLDRERKWLARGTLDGQTKRALQYQAARSHRSRQQQTTAAKAPPRPPPP